MRASNDEGKHSPYRVLDKLAVVEAPEPVDCAVPQGLANQKEIYEAEHDREVHEATNNLPPRPGLAE